jgi:hypothetical protein
VVAANRIQTLAGSSVRGVILHKLMEELLTGEVLPSVEALRERCGTLIPQLIVNSLAILTP